MLSPSKCPLRDRANAGRTSTEAREAHGGCLGNFKVLSWDLRAQSRSECHLLQKNLGGSCARIGARLMTVPDANPHIRRANEPRPPAVSRSLEHDASSRFRTEQGSLCAMGSEMTGYRKAARSDRLSGRDEMLITSLDKTEGTVRCAALAAGSQPGALDLRRGADGVRKASSRGL